MSWILGLVEVVGSSSIFTEGWAAVWVSQVAQLVKNPPVMLETLV